MREYALRFLTVSGHTPEQEPEVKRHKEQSAMHDKSCVHTPFRKRPSWLWQLGSSTLMTYAALRVLWPEVGSPAETLTALLGLGAILVYGNKLRYSAPMWLLGAAILVQLLSWTLGYFHHPEWVSENPKIDRLAKLFIFISVAWWLGGSTKRTLFLWFLAFLGYIASTFILGGGLAEWKAGLSGQRVGFGIRNSQHGAMLFGVAFLGLLIFSSRFLAAGRWRKLRALTWTLLITISSIGVLIGQTRAVWLALSLAIPSTLIFWFFQAGNLKSITFNKNSLLFGFATSVTLCVGLVLFFYQPLMERVTTESQVMVQLLDGNFESIPYTSIGIRINTWIAALEWIEQRPLVGWGGEARGLVIDHTSWLPPFVKANFGHLHNFLLEVWVAYGLLGVGVIATLVIWIGLRTWQAWRAGVMPGDIALFGAGFFIYWLIVNQFEAYNAFWTGVFVHNLVVGGLVTHIWRWQYQAVATTSEDNECAR